jgi:hypothetical protein
MIITQYNKEKPKNSPFWPRHPVSEGLSPSFYTYYAFSLLRVFPRMSATTKAQINSGRSIIKMGTNCFTVLLSHQRVGL